MSFIHSFIHPSYILAKSWRNSLVSKYFCFQELPGEQKREISQQQKAIMGTEQDNEGQGAHGKQH